MTLLLTLVTIYWLTHHITSPLRALVQATQSVQRCDLSRSVAITTQDEIGALGMAFNHMIASYEFRQEAEPHVSTRALELFDHIIADTAQRLQTIGDLENVAEKPMVIGMGIDYPIPPPAGKV